MNKLTESRGSNFRELAPGTFVYAMDNALFAETCDEIIQRFESSLDQQTPGRMGQQGALDPSIKRSTDLRVSGRPDWQDVDGVLKNSLSHALGLIAGIHPFFAANRLHDEGYNLQRTKAGEHYHWHVDSGPGPFLNRQLVAIWYLNNGPESGGQTEFFHQGLKVTPTQGDLILFPPFWTHLHRGVEVQSGTKYIATTWICLDAGS